MDKNVLIQYYDLQEEVKDLRERIAVIEKDRETIWGCVQSSSKTIPYKQHIEIIGATKYKKGNKTKRDVLKAMLEDTLEQQQRKLVEAETYIESLPESKIRTALRHKIYDNWSNTRIGIQMGVDEKTVRNWIYKFFEEEGG